MTNPLTPVEVLKRSDVELLARYNSEVARGIVHNDAWIERMQSLQRQFNLEQYGTEKPVPGAIYIKDKP